jgi:hypothetical protein
MKKILLSSLLLLIANPIFSQINCTIENEQRIIKCKNCEKERSFTLIASKIIEIHEGSLEELLGVCVPIMHIPFARAYNRDKRCNNVNYLECQEEIVKTTTAKETLVFSKEEVEKLLKYFQEMPEQERAAVMTIVQPAFVEYMKR